MLYYFKNQEGTTLSFDTTACSIYQCTGYHVTRFGPSTMHWCEMLNLWWKTLQI